MNKSILNNSIIAALAALVALTVNGCCALGKSRGDETMGMDRRKLNIGAYCLDFQAQSEKHIREISECGLDFMTCVTIDKRTALDYCQKYNVGVIQHNILPVWWGGWGENAGTMKTVHPLSEYEAAAAKYQDHPAVWGINMGDEPSALDFPYFGEISDFVKQKFPGKVPFTNVHPYYILTEYDENGVPKIIPPLSMTSYEAYIEEYCRHVGLDYLCFDHYMYSSSNPEKYFANLDIISKACRNSGRSLWIVLQVNSLDPEKWISENELRAQAYSSLAFGAEVIMWACYSGGWWSNNVLDSNSEKTEQYDKLKHINAEIHSFGDAYMKFRNVSTHFVSFPAEAPALQLLKHSDSVPALNTGTFKNLQSGTPLVVGQMVSRCGNGAQALLVFAADDLYDENNREITVSFQCPNRNVKAVGGHLLQNDDGSYSVNLRSCGAVLLIAE